MLPGPQVPGSDELSFWRSQGGRGARHRGTRGGQMHRRVHGGQPGTEPAGLGLGPPTLSAAGGEL